MRRSDIIILAVGTPSLPNGEADLTYIEGAAAEIAKAMEGHKIIMTKSTVPVGTNEKISKMISSHTHHPFDIVSAPEFYVKAQRFAIPSIPTELSLVLIIQSWNQLCASFIRVSQKMYL